MKAAEPVLEGNLSEISMRQLRSMCNETFKDLDAENPPFGAAVRYEELSAEVRSRAATIRDAGSANVPRTIFRDSVFHSQFELFYDGVVAAYLRYEMRGAQVRLLTTNVRKPFRGLNLEATLIRGALLHTHRRRLNAVPVCSAVAMFLLEYPQYLQLIPAARSTIR
ncbi:N-acetyltransferase (plasmid) [Arthrobacter agilis]|uniref:GNAT family N-acetyltransferase n=1 Tax=Arthrobacter agilis TaxID=37921 RepID=UPI00236663CC|nr:N-acetyltransferase [Arthrobacter agilis]WDF35108.1 N-acetyltransferase [Arthrobacter agilis]